jgi:hypothetical protein
LNFFYPGFAPGFFLSAEALAKADFVYGHLFFMASSLPQFIPTSAGLG